MKKRIVAGIMGAMCLSMALAACVGSKKSTDASSTAEQASASTESASTLAASTEAETKAESKAGETTTADETKQTGSSESSQVNLQGKQWTDMVFAMDGQTLKIPFPYASINSQWTFNLSDYGYDNGYVLNPGDKTTGTIDLKNPAFDKVRFSVGFKNTGSSVQDITASDIWSITMNVADADKYPQIELPGGITWGSTADEILAAYGQPDDDPYVSKELGYTVYNWFNQYTYKMKLTVYDNGGLKAIMLENYEH